MKHFLAGLLTLVLSSWGCQAFALGATAGAKPAARPEAARLAEGLTAELLVAHRAHLRAAPGRRKARLAELSAIARERHDLLALLMRSAPGEVLRQALPDGVRVGFPASVQPLLEHRVEEEGVLSVVQVDMPGEGVASLEYSLQSAHGRRSLHFSGKPTQLLTDSRIKVAGVALDTGIALDSAASSGSVVTIQAALANTYGVQRTLVILVSFKDAASARPFTQAQANTLVFGDTNAFDLENSYQQTSLQGAVTPWYTIDSLSTTCDYNTIADQAKKAANSGGYSTGNYNRHVFVFPGNVCEWWGKGTIGGSPSKAWINAKFGFTVGVVGHELGHNFGLRHSHSLDCGTAVVGDNCTASNYGDTLDIMGAGPNGSAPHFAAFQKELLGWLNGPASPPLTTVENRSGIFSIGNIEAGPSGVPRALKIGNTVAACNAAASEWYYVEKRDAIGFDSFLDKFPGMTGGVVIRRVTGGDPDSSHLLDMTPETGSWTDVALAPGRTFVDPVTGLRIKPLAVSAGRADISVSYPPTSCASPPGIRLTLPRTLWKVPAQTFPLQVVITNTDTMATSFNVYAGKPAGWTSTSVQSPVVAPGASVAVELQVASPANTAPAFYDIPVVATSQASSRSASLNASVAIVVPTELSSGVTVAPIAVGADEDLVYVLPVPPNRTALSFISTGGGGDVDLYVKFGSVPTLDSFDCKSEREGNAETCYFVAPGPGAWYVLVHGFAGASGVALTGQYLPAELVLPELSVGDVTILEGNIGTKIATFPVTLSRAASTPVSFNIATSGGSATPGKDFVAKATTAQTLPAGVTSATFTVIIQGDSLVEGNETFGVHLTKPSGATVLDGTAEGRITNDDFAKISIADAQVTEGDAGGTTAKFVISLSAQMPSPVTFDVVTSNGTAVAGADYTQRSQPGRYLDAGRTRQVFEVTVLGDKAAEGNETLNVTLTNVKGAVLSDGAAVGTIVDDDYAAITSTNMSAVLSVAPVLRSSSVLRVSSPKRQRRVSRKAALD